jgi:hypothetical protein
MSIEGALGILATILLGVLAIYVAVRRRYPGQIYFIREQNIVLFDDIVRTLPGLTVLYRDQPLSQHIVLLKGALINTGRKDIASSMVEDPITLRLSGNCRWLGANFLGASSKTAVEVKVLDDQTIAVSFRLLRCGEFLRVQALAEVPAMSVEMKLLPENSPLQFFEHSLSFHHRIEDTQDVLQDELPPIRSFIKRGRYWYWEVLAMVGMAAAYAMALPIAIGEFIALWSGVEAPTLFVASAAGFAVSMVAGLALFVLIWRRARRVRRFRGLLKCRP